ncbi:MAG: N-acetylmuramoyl-L-alanine amidase [Lachnospiraceae bacterium]|nr:N-acetylmuramoyl-L-alanine amidase [Lachnospiraceae bacterium]
MGVVVVIDPGHGGENLGGFTDEFVEKELTIKVAKYMQERLRQYDGVEVYLTHENTSDPDLGREERAKIAKSYNADFLYSIHFNMSSDHTLYGCEVWTSAFGEYYKKGQEFAGIEMEGLKGLGFYDRGIKTRLGKNGDDYYGIILNAKKEGIPAVIIEHCHMDEDRDADYLRSHGEDAYKTFGYTDADAVAKYFHLSSSTLGVDYSNYTYNSVPLPTAVMGPDLTPADECYVELISTDDEACTAKIKITAKDAESKMLYYRLSYDGGVTFGKTFPWSTDKEAKVPVDDDSIEVDVDLAAKSERDLVVKVYNRLDRKADSNVITLPAKKEAVEESMEEESIDETGLSVTDGSGDLSEGEFALDSDDYSNNENYTEVNIDTTARNVDDNNGGMGILILAIGIMIAAIATIGYGVFLYDRKQKARRERNIRRKQTGKY